MEKVGKEFNEWIHDQQEQTERFVEEHKGKLIKWMENYKGGCHIAQPDAVKFQIRWNDNGEDVFEYLILTRSGLVYYDCKYNDEGEKLPKGVAVPLLGYDARLKELFQKKFTENTGVNSNDTYQLSQVCDKLGLLNKKGYE